MAGITTSFASKPVLSPKTTPYPFSQSKRFGLRFNNVYLINSCSCSSLSSAVSSPVTARFGGGGPRRPSSDRRKQQSDAEDDDKALDISTIRLAWCQRASEAIRMADEADLDLVILSSPDADPPVLRIMDYKYENPSGAYLKSQCIEMRGFQSTTPPFLLIKIVC